jgi:hypothetical protein
MLECPARTDAAVYMWVLVRVILPILAPCWRRICSRSFRILRSILISPHNITLIMALLHLLPCSFGASLQSRSHSGGVSPSFLASPSGFASHHRVLIRTQVIGAQLLYSWVFFAFPSHLSSFPLFHPVPLTFPSRARMPPYPYPRALAPLFTTPLFSVPIIFLSRFLYTYHALSTFPASTYHTRTNINFFYFPTSLTPIAPFTPSKSAADISD